jgi:hypothetical protein
MAIFRVGAEPPRTRQSYFYYFNKLVARICIACGTLGQRILLIPHPTPALARHKTWTYSASPCAKNAEFWAGT